MRITMGFAAIASFYLLAGCGGASNNGAAATTPAAKATVSPERRARQIGQCLQTAPSSLPAGSNANAFCTCAVDKMLGNGISQSEAVNQCAAEMHITLRDEQ